MRLQIISDMHVDVVGGFVPTLASNVDAVVVAGDVCEGAPEAMAFLRAHIARAVPIILVLGNHEFYGRGLLEERRAAIAAAAEHDIVLLDDSSAVVAGVRFIGATLWTDFRLYGAGQQQRSMMAAQDHLNDYRRISLSRGSAARFQPPDALALHSASLAYIAAQLDQPFDGPSVVVTHHAPHTNSIHARFAGSAVNPAFASDLAASIERHRPMLWVHGHVHNCFDYVVGPTRVVCNPLGYGTENPAFDPLMVVEV